MMKCAGKHLLKWKHICALAMQLEELFGVPFPTSDWQLTDRTGVDQQIRKRRNMYGMNVHRI